MYMTRKSILRTRREPRTSRSPDHDVVRKQQNIKVYKLQLFQKVQENDDPRRYDFAAAILSL
jgi:hypothetical protein